jgi:hypothetical protein
LQKQKQSNNKNNQKLNNRNSADYSKTCCSAASQPNTPVVKWDRDEAGTGKEQPALTPVSQKGHCLVMLLL